MATIKSKYESLIVEVKNYVSRFNSTRSVDACTLPAYGQPGQPEDKAKSSTNVFFVKDLISQVMTAKTLGYQTRLYSDGDKLVVVFVEPPAPLPTRLLYP